MSDSSKAVFLSYASQDAEAVRRIAEALRAAGVEVWFDQNELVGGDAWDAKIRKQIRECALFVPMISANTQARAEGYFRLEWRLADQRTHLMGKSRAFLLPVCIDGTKDSDADVPDSFLAVQWVRFPRGEVPADFAGRVRLLLGLDATRDARPLGSGETGRDLPGPPARSSARRTWVIPAIVGLALASAVGFWRWSRPAAAPASAGARVATPGSVISPEIAALRARIVPESWTREDYDVLKGTLDRLIEGSSGLADAWALRSIIASLQVMRGYDFGTRMLAAGKSDAERATRIAPGAPLGELALALHHAAMMTRGGDPEAPRPHLDRALAVFSGEALSRWTEIACLGWAMHTDEANAQALKWLAVEPGASFPKWVLGMSAYTRRQPEEVERWSTAAAGAGNPTTAVRAYGLLFDLNFYLRADLPAARAVLERIPGSDRLHPRVVYNHWLLALAEGRGDDAIRDLARLPDAMLYDQTFNGPKALLAGIAHARAGRTAAAAAQFVEAERVLRELLATDTENEKLRATLAVTLAYAGRPSEVRGELSAIEPAVRGRQPYVFTAHTHVLIAEAYAVLGDVDAMLPWLRLLFGSPSSLPYTPASFRLDPRFGRVLADPRVVAFLAEYAPVIPPRAAESAPRNAGPPEASDSAPAKSVAVLAFANLSDEKANEYFSDGISEELLNVLAKVPGLKVSARTSAFHFKGKDTPIPEIAKQLGVAYVVEGSVRKAGDKVRITAQLIKAADGYQVWSDTFTRDLKDVFAVQDEIARLVAAELQLKLVGAPAGAEPLNPEAFRLYLEGRQAWNLRNRAGLARSRQLFEQALALEPNFARAMVGLADALEASEEGAVKARTLVEQALKIDPQLGEGYATLGIIREAQWDFPGAEAALRKAIELNPNHATAHQWMGRLWERQGFLDRALASLKKATELDPLAPRILDNYAAMLLWRGQDAEALTVADRVLSLHPNSVNGHRYRAEALWRVGRPEEALTEARWVVVNAGLEGGPAMRLASVMHILRRAGLAEETRSIARDFSAGTPYDELWIALGAGDFERAMALVDHWTVDNLSVVFWSELLDPVRGDPRFRSYLKRKGIVEPHDRAQETRASLRGRSRQ